MSFIYVFLFVCLSTHCMEELRPRTNSCPIIIQRKINLLKCIFRTSYTSLMQKPQDVSRNPQSLIQQATVKKLAGDYAKRSKQKKKIYNLAEKLSIIALHPLVEDYSNNEKDVEHLLGLLIDIDTWRNGRNELIITPARKKIHDQLRIKRGY